MSLPFYIISMAGGFGASQLCWKYTESWRIAAQPGPTEGNARYERVKLIAFWCSIGAFLASMEGTAFILVWLGY
jgi:hypothetical protein